MSAAKATAQLRYMLRTFFNIIINSPPLVDHAYARTDSLYGFIMAR